MMSVRPGTSLCILYMATQNAGELGKRRGLSGGAKELGKRRGLSGGA